MSERLKSKLNNWMKSLSNKTIYVDDVKAVVWTNKDYRTEGQLKMAIEYLTNNGFEVIEKIEEPKIVEEIENNSEDESAEDVFEAFEDESVEEIDVDLFDEMLLNAENADDNIADLENSTESNNSNDIVYSGTSAMMHSLSNIDTSTLPAEDIINLIEQAQSGDRDAFNTIIEHNIRLVINIARKYNSRIASSGILSLEDLIQEGNLGLMKAVEAFNLGLGYKFTTYATYWIKQRIIRCITNDSRTIRIPSHVIELIMLIRKIQTNFYNEHNDYPTEEYIAHYINTNDLIRHKRDSDITAKEIEKIIRYWDNQGLVSLSMPVGEEDDSTLGDFIPSHAFAPNTEIEYADLKKHLLKTLPKILKDNEYFIICNYYGINNEEKSYTLHDIGKMLGVSGERVRVIKKNALEKLSHSSVGVMLKDFFSTRDYNE